MEKMAGYFYVVCSADKKVLDCGAGIASSQLIVAVRRPDWDTQLWTWDDQGRLVNKAGGNLVADVEKKNKDPGARVILWSKTDGANQAWRMEGDTIKCGLNDLALDRDRHGKIIMRTPLEDDENQKWEIVPCTKWDSYVEQKMSLVGGKKNPVEEAAFWATVAEDSMIIVVGFTIKEFKNHIPEAVKTILDSAEKIKKITKKTGIARIAGGGASLLGGGALVAGIILAPFTFGASLGLTAAGIGVGIAGGATSVGSGIAKGILGKEQYDEIKTCAGPLFHATMRLHSFLQSYTRKLLAADKYLKTEEGKELVDRILQQRSEGTVAEPELLAIVEIFAHPTLGVARTAISIAEIPVAVGRSAFSVGRLATFATAAGGQALSKVLAGVGIVIGAWDVVFGVKDFTNAEELAAQFQTTATTLRREATEMAGLYEELTAAVRPALNIAQPEVDQNKE